MAPTHPHIEAPTDQQLLELVADRPEVVQQLYLGLHQVVLAALPGVKASVDTVDAQIGYGAKQYGYTGWGMGSVWTAERWVTLSFIRGAWLDDPAGLLTGQGIYIRSLRLGGLPELEQQRVAITALLVDASQVMSRPRD